MAIETPSCKGRVFVIVILSEAKDLLGRRSARARPIKALCTIDHPMRLDRSKDPSLRSG